MLSETPTRTRSAQKRRTRQALLDAAAEVIRERGLDGATARAISDRAGVAAGTFFVHFPEVPALLDVLLDEHLERALVAAYGSLPDDVPLVDALVHVADGLFDGYGREPDLARACLAATLFRADSSGPSAARLAEFRTWVIGRMVRAQEEGELSTAIDLRLAFEHFFCLYAGLVIGGLRGDLTRDRQREVVRVAVTSMVGGGS